MKRLLTTAALILTLVIPAACLAAPFPVEATDDSFSKEALQADTPVVIEFWASYCKACKATAPVVDQFAKDMDGKVKVVKVKIDDCPKTTERYDVQKYPTFMYVAGGEIKKSVSGSFDDVEKMKRVMVPANDTATTQPKPETVTSTPTVNSQIKPVQTGQYPKAAPNQAGTDIQKTVQAVTQTAQAANQAASAAEEARRAAADALAAQTPESAMKAAQAAQVAARSAMLAAQQAQQSAFTAMQAAQRVSRPGGLSAQASGTPEVRSSQNPPMRPPVGTPLPVQANPVNPSNPAYTTSQPNSPQAVNPAANKVLPTVKPAQPVLPTQPNRTVQPNQPNQPRPAVSAASNTTPTVPSVPQEDPNIVVGEMITIEANDDDSFNKEIILSKLPVFVEFYTPTCAFCKKAEPTIRELVKEYSGKIKFVKVNLRKNTTIAAQYDVKGTPGMYMFRGGNVSAFLVGSKKKEYIIKKLDLDGNGSAQAVDATKPAAVVVQPTVVDGKK